MSTSDLADRLVTYTCGQLERLVDGHLTGFDLPRVFAGHPVGSDVRADLVFTLGLLHDAGVEQVCGTPVVDAIVSVLRPIDGPGTHTFFSYRVAETLRRWGPFDDNELLLRMTDAEHQAVAEACDSSSWIELLGAGLPANYAAVLARCELARLDLGLIDDEGAVESLVDRVRTLLDRNPNGYLDDSESGTGARYDIYTADIYLFTEPLAAWLGDTWSWGVRAALDLVAQVSTRDGSAVPWGRSTGALASCLTIELGALALARRLTEEQGAWLGLATNAFDRFDRWFRDGLTTAHQHASPYGYRGPERRLQMSLDCLGKLAYAAVHLAAVPDGIDPPNRDEQFADRDHLLTFDAQVHAAVWAFRSRHLAFDLPLVGPTRSDYLGFPRNPGLFEVPVDSSLATGVAAIGSGDVRYAGGGTPTTVEHGEGWLAATFDGYPEVDSTRSADRRFGGTRELRVDVDRRTLQIREHLSFDQAPDSVAFQVTEAAGRPLRVEMSASAAHRIDVIDVAGLKEYRSFWGELPRVHQVDVDPAEELTITCRITPKLRVATNAAHHHYHRSLYEPIAADVHVTSMTSPLLDDLPRALDKLRDVDVFHLHWPEWFVPPESDAARAFCDLLDRAEVRLVWTQHNLEPHTKDERHRDVYQVFAQRADLVIHHSRWGWDRVEEEYSFGSETAHVLVPHGHFGALMGEVASVDRAEVEAELGLAPCAIRVGVIGAPRAEKRTQAFMEAFARVRRDDLQLLVLSLGPDERVPDDPRITARPYEFVDRTTYNRRLAAIDVVALPYDPDGAMLTTGVVGDVVGLGLPAITSQWEFLTEVLGDAAIDYHEASLVNVLEKLDRPQLERAAAASRELQPIYDWAVLAHTTLAALEDLGTRKL